MSCSLFKSPDPVNISGQRFLVLLCKCIALILVGTIDLCANMYSAATYCSTLFYYAQPIISTPLALPPQSPRANFTVNPARYQTVIY